MLRILSALLITASMFGCNGILGADASPYAGEYAFTGISSEIERLEASGSVLTLSTDLTYSSDVTVFATWSGTAVPVMRPEHGTYRLKGDTIEFRSSDGAYRTASVNERTLTITSAGYAVEFERLEGSGGKLLRGTASN